jgi:hypothetical protein
MMTEAHIIRWKRAAIEVVTIVASILLAFAIDAWWQERGERNREEALIEGLVIEFDAAETVLGELIGYHRSNTFKFEELNTLLSVSEEHRDAARIIDLSHDLWRVRVYAPRMPIYENLVDSIGLGFIQDEGLRSALRLYQDEAINQKGWDDFLKAFDQDLMVATLAPRLPYFHHVFGDSQSEGGPAVDLRLLAQDMEFRNLIALRADGERKLVDLRLELLKAVEEVQSSLSPFE